MYVYIIILILCFISYVNQYLTNINTYFWESFFTSFYFCDFEHNIYTKKWTNM